jgi:hypothetical protein
MKLYCPKCYNKLDYKFTKPKFCTKCGASISNASDVKIDEDEKNEDKLKIELLEKKIKELSASKKKTSTNKLSKQYNDDIDNDDDVDSDDTDDTDDEDYEETQRHIDNFKRKNKKSGVSVEYAPSNNSISFGKLMEDAASGKMGDSEDFKMIQRGAPSKTPEKILEEFKIESASKARMIEID